MRPHRWQPSRLLCPWDSPGKNTGVGCHFLLQCMKVKSESQIAQSCPTLSNLMDCSAPGSSIHGIFQARVLEWGAISLSTRLLLCLGYCEYCFYEHRGACMLFWIILSFDLCPGGGLLDYMIILFLVFWVAVPIYIPINSVGGVPFLHSPSSICCL